MKLKEIKTNGYYVYAHITPEKEAYFGVSQMQPSRRWNPSAYKGTALYEYIQRFGWKNIEHLVIQDGLTKEDALKIEDWFITNATKDGFCINKQRSGLVASDVNAYQKQYYATNEGYRERRKAQKKQYYAEHQEEKKQWRDEHREQRKAYDKQRNSTVEGRIYTRVAAYNQYHPDKVIETPMEAKQKYLESGYVPSYIKNDDLITNTMFNFLNDK